MAEPDRRQAAIPVRPRAGVNMLAGLMSGGCTGSLGGAAFRLAKKVSEVLQNLGWARQELKILPGRSGCMKKKQAGGGIKIQ